MGWIGCVHCEKFRRDFVARTIAPVRPVFAPSFVWQPNGPKCIKIVRNAPKHEFRVQWGGSRALVAKNSDTTSWCELCTSSAHFAPSFVNQPNGPKCTKIIRTHQNMSLGSNGVDRVPWLQKIPTRHRGMNFCTSSAVLHRVS